ncbi:DNA-binding transcriptional LysR family regulator [Brevibacterium sanguinis]|uniref:DNA-binding transcriptional LysR family regulator n=2 Tax=Brevibacterium TaxID=1696 RepID=A0A366IMS4_9MICO|nr:MULTISPECIES: LysR family transcriptional regulator [Brevibacterium]RBP68200.1 DNA-binding transcriptional LysR family regulator [Brevibacterium sanguinis]RBP74383.1 DNA-binding transcriptional LysR family regulator [Brevibacterium celere]
MWDLNRLRIWRAVVATGSVAAAARSLNYTSATVSQHITTLQRSVGAPLYRRSGRGIEITDLGRRLAEESADVFTGLARLDSLVESHRWVNRPRMRIAAFTSFNARLLPDIIEPVVGAHPDLRFDIQLNEPAKVRRSHCTIEIRNEVPQQGETRLPGMTRTVLFDDDYRVVVADTHEFAGLGSVPFKDLADERWVDYDLWAGPTSTVVDLACAAAGFQPRTFAASEDEFAALALVASDLAITVLPRLSTVRLPHGLVAVDLVDPVPLRRVVMHVRDREAHLPHVRAFVTAAEAVVAEYLAR